MALTKFQFRLKMPTSSHSRDGTVSPNGSLPVDYCGKFGAQTLVFGLEWVPIEDQLETFLEDRRRSGARSYALTSSQDLVGLSQQPYPARSSSAALYFADVLSKGASELYIVELNNTQGLARRCGVVALIDRMPVPGFDRVVSAAQVDGLIEEFRMLQAGQNVLLFSNMPELTEAEPLRPALFNTAVSEAQVHRLRNKKVLWLSIVALLIFVGLAYWAYSAHQERQRQLTLQLQQQASDPNLLYEQAIRSALNNTGEPGSKILQRWQKTVYPIPILVKGWRMESFTCDQQACRVNWAREHGSIADFTANLPAGAKLQPLRESAKEQVGKPNWVLSPLLTTLHPLQGSSSGVVLDRAQLPLADQAVKEMGNFLQDLSLLIDKEKSGATLYDLATPGTFGMPGAVTQLLEKPVESGKLSFPVHGANLHMITLPNYVVIRELSLVKQDSINSIASSILIIKGEYYAKGKPF